MQRFNERVIPTYLGKRMHDLRQDVRVWFCANGLDKGITHEVPHLGEVFRSPNAGTLQ